MSNINEVVTRSLFEQAIYNYKFPINVNEFEKEDRWMGTTNDGNRPEFTDTSNIVPSIPKHIFEKASEYAPLYSRLKPIFITSNTFDSAKVVDNDNISFVAEGKNLVENDFKLTPLKLKAQRIGFATTVSQHLANHSDIAIPFVEEKIYKAMAEKLDRIIIDGGDGELKPTGYLCNIDRKEEQIKIPVAFNEDHLKKVANKINCNIRKNGFYIFNETVFEEKISDLTTVDERGITLLNGYPVFTTTRGFDSTVETKNKIGAFTNIEETFETIVQTNMKLLKINKDTLSTLRASTTYIIESYLDLGVVNEKATMPIVIG